MKLKTDLTDNGKVIICWIMTVLIIVLFLLYDQIMVREMITTFYILGIFIVAIAIQIGYLTAESSFVQLQEIDNV